MVWRLFGFHTHISSSDFFKVRRLSRSRTLSDKPCYRDAVVTRSALNLRAGFDRLVAFVCGLVSEVECGGV